ncbi:MAG: hypothetical protein H0T51_20220 [Pirellulales bacterium]|nr:hypothetical protein [Pirellulales bacterium]
MATRRIVPLLALVGLVALSSCGSSGGVSTISGTVSVDGQPVESGIIHFQSNASSASSGGGAVTDGRFQVVSDDGFVSGEYTVVLQAFRKTGRTINDPQKGKVEQSATVVLSEPSQAVTLGSENAESLSLNYTAKSK